MQAEQLRQVQEPIKLRYREQPETAKVVLKSHGEVSVKQLRCTLATPHGEIQAGLHPAAGGSGLEACSGEMLLESLIACAGVTLSAVATAMAIPIKKATIDAEGEMDFRGTLGIDRQTPVGITAIRLVFISKATRLKSKSRS